MVAGAQCKGERQSREATAESRNESIRAEAIVVGLLIWPMRLARRMFHPIQRSVLQNDTACVCQPTK